MPKALAWTDARVTTLRDMIQSGASINQTARALGIGHHSVAKKMDELGFPRRLDRRAYKGAALLAWHKQRAENQPAPSQVRERHAGEPLPPGSSITWGAIISGTSLDGMPYPTRGAML